MDTFPSSVNLHQWSLVEDQNCKILVCGKRKTMAHILSGCQVALTQGRYRWRHVLSELTNFLEVERRRKRPETQKQGHIQCKREGEATADTRAPRHAEISAGYRGHDWELRVDLDRKLVFPNVVETNRRPDTVLVSKQSKKLVYGKKIVKRHRRGRALNMQT